MALESPKPSLKDRITFAFRSRQSLQNEATVINSRFLRRLSYIDGDAIARAEMITWKPLWKSQAEITKEKLSFKSRLSDPTSPLFMFEIRAQLMQEDFRKMSLLRRAAKVSFWNRVKGNF